MINHILLVVFGFLLIHPLSGCQDFEQERKDREHHELLQRRERQKEFESAFDACQKYLTSVDEIDAAKLSQLSHPFHDEPKLSIEFLSSPERSLNGSVDKVGTGIYLSAHAVAGWDFDRSSRLSNIPNRTKSRLQKGFGTTGVGKQIALFRSRQPKPPGKWLKRMDTAEALLDGDPN